MPPKNSKHRRASKFGHLPLKIIHIFYSTAIIGWHANFLTEVFLFLVKRVIKRMKNIIYLSSLTFRETLGKKTLDLLLRKSMIYTFT